jgi:hypothetical protein
LFTSGLHSRKPQKSHDLDDGFFQPRRPKTILFIFFRLLICKEVELHAGNTVTFLRTLLNWRFEIENGCGLRQTISGTENCSTRPANPFTGFTRWGVLYGNDAAGVTTFFSLLIDPIMYEEDAMPRWRGGRFIFSCFYVRVGIIYQVEEKTTIGAQTFDCILERSLFTRLQYRKDVVSFR